MSETLPAKLSVLPESWIDKIFGHMSAYYGSQFADRWKDCNLAEVKRIWAAELASFSDNPECFAGALKSLIEGSIYPPTLPEFVALCRRHYQQPRPANAILTHQAGEPLSRDEARMRFAEIKARFVSRKDAAAGEDVAA